MLRRGNSGNTQPRPNLELGLQLIRSPHRRAIERAGSEGMPLASSRENALDRLRPEYFRRRARLCSYDEIAQSLARIEHARLHGRFRNGENLGDFTHRFLMIIDEVYNLTMRGRQGRH